MDSQTLPPFVRTLLDSWRRIAAFVLLGGAGCAVYAWFAPKWYEAQLVVIPGTTNKSPLGLAAAVSGELPIDLGIGGTDAERIQAVLKSRSVADAIIDKFGLIERYHSAFREDTREELFRHCLLKLEKRANTVSVTCEDTDPGTAQAMAEEFGEVGNRVFRRISASAASEEVTFLTERLAATKHLVDETSTRVRNFEQEHHIVDLPEQSKAVVSALTSLKGQELSKEIELGYLNSFSSSDEATAQQLRRQLSVMSGKMKTLSNGPGENASGKATGYDSSNMFPPASAVPQFRYELTQLYREQKIQEAAYLLLNQRFEIAKANAARETSTFQVLDAPVRATHKSRPKRAKIILIGLFVGFLFGCAWVLGRGRLAAPTALTPPVRA